MWCETVYWPVPPFATHNAISSPLVPGAEENCTRSLASMLSLLFLYVKLALRGALLLLLLLLMLLLILLMLLLLVMLLLLLLLLLLLGPGSDS